MPISESTRKVLDHFGLDESDVEKLDPFVDFKALAKSIEDPTKVAVCHILDGDGKIVVNYGKPVRVHVEVPIKNALKELAKMSLRWIKWF